MTVVNDTTHKPRGESIAAGISAVIFLLILALSGCSKPPDGVAPRNILEYAYTVLTELNPLSGDVDGFREYFKAREQEDRVLEFAGGSVIEVQSSYGKDVPGIVLRSLPDNQLFVETPLYVTEGRKNEALISADGKTWYSTRTDFDRGIDNFRNRYHYRMDYRPRSKYLRILYTLSVAFNESLEERKVWGNRPVTVLRQGMVFKHENSSRINYDLSDKIVYIPRGTIIDGNFKLAGNLLETDKEDGVIRLKILRDLYFYQRGKRFGLSFDNSEWRVNIFAFKIGSLLQVYADADDRIFVRFGLHVDYAD